MDTAEFVGDTNRYAHLSEEYKGLIKAKPRECPVDPSIVIKDMQLDVRGPNED